MWEGKSESGHAHSVQKHVSFFHLGQFKLQPIVVISKVAENVGLKCHVRVVRVIRGLRDQHYVRALASPAFELACIACRELIVFCRQ